MIEDNPLVRDGIMTLLNAQPDVRVVAAVDSGDAVLPQIQKTKPQVVLVDAGLGDHDSKSLVEGIAERAPETKVIVMDFLPAEQDVVEFVKAGASGFIVKDATTDELLAAIRSVASGAKVLPPALTGTLLSKIVEHAGTHPAPEVIDAVRLTPHEREVIELVAEGRSDKEIAERQHLAVSTVKSHVHHILLKLALRNQF
ncbi:MAG: response regulator transcription factor [Gemmatimonadota bacterium]